MGQVSLDLRIDLLYFLVLLFLCMSFIYRDSISNHKFEESTKKELNALLSTVPHAVLEAIKKSLSSEDTSSGDLRCVSLIFWPISLFVCPSTNRSFSPQRNDLPGI